MHQLNKQKRYHNFRDPVDLYRRAHLLPEAFVFEKEKWIPDRNEELDAASTELPPSMIPAVALLSEVTCEMGLFRNGTL